MSRQLPVLRPRAVIRALERAGFVLLRVKAVITISSTRTDPSCGLRPVPSRRHQASCHALDPAPGKPHRAGISQSALSPAEPATFRRSRRDVAPQRRDATSSTGDGRAPTRGRSRRTCVRERWNSCAADLVLTGSKAKRKGSDAKCFPSGRRDAAGVGRRRRPGGAAPQSAAAGAAAGASYCTVDAGARTCRRTPFTNTPQGETSCETFAIP
jgi:hypothetical protein